jgi:hypothetical protein
LFGKSRSDYIDCLKRLRSNLRVLDTEMKTAIIRYKQFEKLEGDNLYSIRDLGKMNDRVIYAFIDRGGAVLLLTAFLEKKGTADYKKHMDTAKARLKQEGVR